MSASTIYALSTVFGKSGVAVIRISGPKVLDILSALANIDVNNIKSRHAYFTAIRKKGKGDMLDKSLVLYFKAPQSFTGEDVAEIQCHGSKAVLNSILNELSGFDGVRLAEPGEFSKRAFYNGKMVALVNNKVVAVPLKDIAGKLKSVPKDSEVVETARKMGISFGE